MKALRVKQYGYMVCTAVLFVVTIFAIFTGIRTASAEQSIVTITSPKPDQKLAQKAQTITGRAPALKRVRVFDGTKLIGDATADVQGNWNLAWKAVLPGQHQLNAYLVDGTLYKTAPLSDQSLTGVSLNNGQPITNYTTGLSNPDSLVYDQSNQYTYALNRNNHTVSVVNTNTKAYVSTISYATADALAPNSYDTSPCHCKNYAYAYDANSRQLFIFDLERIYIISTQTNQVARTITLDMPVQDGEASGTPEYRLYVDQQAQYVYFYVAAGTYNDQPIQRYNVGTGQKDQDFNIEGGRVVVAHNGDVYYINKNGSDATNAEGGRLYKYGGAKVDLSSVGCQTADDENLAASVTQNSIYVGCYDGPATSSPSKQIAINTENGALSDVSLANDASMKWLTQGNLVADRLALYSGSGNLTIKSLNTSNNQPLPDISYPSLGDSQPAQSLRSSFAVSTDGKYTFIASSGDGVLIFKTINSETASDIASYVYKYSWSTNNSEVTIGARQMNFFPSIDYLLQDFKKPVFVGDNIMYISLQPANALELLDTTSGDFQEISHGVAAPRKVYSSKQNNRLFTMADSTLRDNDTLVPFLSNQIKVSNLQTGAYEQTITLGVRDFAFAGYVSPDGNQLYIFSMDAADLFSGSNDAPITIYRFNTQTLTIDKTYQDIAHEDAGYEAQLLYGLTLNESNMGMSGDELIYGNLDTTKVYFLNVNSGELRTYTNTPDAPVTSNNALPFAGALAVDPTGKYVAVFHGVHFDDGLFGREVKVIKVSDLSVQSTDVSTRVGTALSFTESGELLVGSFSQSADASFTLLNPDDASIIKNKTSLISLGLKFSSGNVSLICWPTAAHPLKEGGEYVAFTLVCLNISSESYLFTTQQVLIDGRNFNYLNALETSNFSNISSDQVSVFAALNSMGAPLADTTVSLATQNVKVVADSISITQPAANKKIAAGERTITGTATPDQTLTIKIDGKSIGSVTADEYGLWSKKYRFEGTESKIKAEFVVPSRDKAFINTVDANMQDSTFRSRMATVSIDGGVEKIVELPDGLVAVSSIASQKAGKVYAIGFQPNSGGGRLLTFDAKTSALISNVSLDNDFLSALSSENGTSFNGVVSKDGTLLYILAGGNLLQVRTADGSLQRSYPLGQEFSDAAQDIPPFAGSIAISEKHKQAAIPYMNGKGTAFLDMNTGIVTHIAVPDGVTIIKALFDDTRDSIYVYTSYQEAQSISYTVSAFALSSMDMLWQQTFTQYTGAMPDMVLSGSGDKVAIIASIVPNGDANATQVSLLEMSTDDGSLTTTNLQFDSNAIDTFLQTLSSGYFLTMRLSASNMNGRYYLSMGNLLGSGLLLSFDRSEARAKVQFVSTEDLASDTLPGSVSYFSGNIANNFTYTMPALTLSAERKVSFVSTTTPPKQSPVGCVGNCSDIPKQPCLNQSCLPITPVDTKTNKKSKTLVGASTGSNDVPLQTSTPIVLWSNLGSGIKRFTAKVPTQLVNIFPYVLLLMLIALCAYYLYQAQKELRREDRMRALFEKQKVLTEEKRNFLELTSHYLRTPLTYIKAGSEMLLRNNKDMNATELTESVNHLGLFIESLVEEASSTKEPQEVILPEHKAWSPFLKKSFILPILGFAVTAALFYLIFGVIGGRQFGPARYVTQIGLLFIAFQVFYGMFKNHHNILEEESYLAQVINNEDQLDHTRTKLIKDASEQLQTRTDHLTSVLNKIQGQDTNKAIMRQGVERLQELAKAFALVGQLEQGVLMGKVEPVSVRRLAAEVIEPLSAQFKEKKVKVEVSGFDAGIMLTTNKPLAEVTLKTLLENALQASKEGSSLVVKCLNSEGRVAFQVIDHGAGIPKDKIDRLFKPFVRVGPVTTFNREGIGLSLYLDRLIMHALGGEVEIVSRFKHGTTATVTFAQTPSA